MKRNTHFQFTPCLTGLLALAVLGSAGAQFQRQPTPNDTLTSYKILSEKRVIFKMYAPHAQKAAFSSSDMPAAGWQGAEMTKQENGVWTATLSPVDPGSYRYNFNVDGVPVIDPRNPIISQSNMNTWSLMHIPGADFMDIQHVPHGHVAEVTYYSTSLKRFRRMHVYAPPGYESGKGEFPVFYLLHGAFDCDDSWSTVGRAGFILDNLIAEGKAVPMVVVMPAGHTGPFRFGGERPATDPFLNDFRNDIRPYIESHYRVRTDRKHRAIAGLSMGGGHTLAIAVPNLKDYGYIGVFSSGVFGIAGGRGGFGVDGATWEERNQDILDDADLKKGLELVWFATGKDDFLIETSRATVDVLKKHGFDVTFKETSGGHTWINWREYLHEFAPLLFRGK